MDVIFNFTPDRVSKLETLIKLRDNQDNIRQNGTEIYNLKFKALKSKFNISDAELKEYEVLKFKEAERLKAEELKNSITFNGVRFKDKASLTEYLTSQKPSEQLKFFFKGILNKFRFKTS